MKIVKYAYIDVETTGLDERIHGIHQISLIIDIEGREPIFKDWNVAPFEADIIDDRALGVGRVTEKEIRAYPPPNVVFAELSKLLGQYVDKYDKTDKFYFVGYNSPFDNQFMREFLRKNGSDYFGSYFHNPDICILRAAAMECIRQGKRPDSFRLSSLAEFYGIAAIDDSRWHDASFDIRITRKIHKKLERSDCRQSKNNDFPHKLT